MENLKCCQNTGNLICSSSKFLDSKEDIAIFTVTFSTFFEVSLLMKLLQISEIGTGKFPVGQGICKYDLSGNPESMIMFLQTNTENLIKP